MNPSKHAQQGFSLIEVMVSLVIICIGVLGMLAMQGRSVQLTQSTVSQSQAVLLANNLLELMRSNPGGALSSDLFSASSSYTRPLVLSSPMVRTRPLIACHAVAVREVAALPRPILTAGCRMLAICCQSARHC
jgi:prepilin-type N-terminal cleavage/methylation domain-containing protein